jgi:hypothetical protein
MLSFRFTSLIVVLILLYSCKKDKYCPEVIVKSARNAGYPLAGFMKADKYCENWEGAITSASFSKDSNGKSTNVSMYVKTYFEDSSTFETISFYLPLRKGRFPISSKYNRYPDSIGKVYVDYSLYDEHTPYDPYRAEDLPENYLEITVFDTINHKIEGRFHMRLRYWGLESKPQVQDRELLFSNGTFKSILYN